MAIIEARRRDEVLKKAAHLFSTKGYHATTMKDIASELEILPGSLYHHIESKESLLLEIMRAGIEALLEAVRPIATGSLPPDEKLRAIIGIHVRLIASHTDVLTVFLHEIKSIPPALRAEQMALRDEYDHLLRDVIRQGIERGCFRPLDPRITTFAMLGMVNWLYSWYRPGGGLSADEIAEQFVTLICSGLVPSPDWDGAAAPASEGEGT